MAAADPILLLAWVRAGDMVQLTPLAKGLKRRHPDSPVVACVLPEFEGAAGLMDGVDEIMTIDRNALYRLSLRNDLPLKSMLDEAKAILSPLLSRKYRIAFNVTLTPTSIMVMYLLDARDKRGPVMTPDGNKQVHHPWMLFLYNYQANKDTAPFNLVDICAQTGDVGNHKDPIPVSIRVPEEAETWAEAFLAEEGGGEGDGPLVAIQLGASDSHKVWHPSSFILTCSNLRERFGPVRYLFVGGKEEREVCERAFALVGDPGSVMAAGKTSLLQLAALLRRCDLMISNDTGPMHIASAVGTRILSVALGPIHYSNTSPYGEGHAVIQSRAVCSPCSFHVKCVNPECKNMVTPQAVAGIAARMLAANPLAARSIPDSPEFADCFVVATEWGEDGLLDYRPVLDRPDDFRRRLSLAYRKVWGCSLLGTGPLPGGQNLVPAGDGGLNPIFRQLEGLAFQGREAASEILKHSRNPKGKGLFGKKLQAIRGSAKGILELGLAVPEVNSLCEMFAQEQENLKGRELESAARENVEIFGKLLRRTRSLAYLLADNVA